MMPSFNTPDAFQSSSTASTGTRFLIFWLLLALSSEQKPLLVIVAIILVLIVESSSAHNSARDNSHTAKDSKGASAS